MNKKPHKCVDAELTCKATAALEQEVAEELEVEDKCLAELLDQKDADEEQE
tara:strand:+ start:181 stop:333 length:153 start_codon:yes stop_codon:yes gene_type:complete